MLAVRFALLATCVVVVIVCVCMHIYLVLCLSLIILFTIVVVFFCVFCVDLGFWVCYNAGFRVFCVA